MCFVAKRKVLTEISSFEREIAHVRRQNMQGRLALNALADTRERATMLLIPSIAAPG